MHNLTDNQAAVVIAGMVFVYCVLRLILLALDARR